MKEKDAKRYTVKNVFPDWRPDKKTRQYEKNARRMKRFFQERQ
jgi:hypothetical protein